MIDRLFSNKDAINRALDAAWTKNEVISQNISNVDTPNYKKSTVSFENELTNALDKNGIQGYVTNEKHIKIGRKDLSDVKVTVQKDNSESAMRMDGNNVDIDSEMSELARNSIWYNALSKQAGYSSVKTVLRDIK